MESRETEREHKKKRKKKRKLDEELPDYSDVKKKRKKTDEDAQEENESMENTHTLHRKRKRKDSEGESDWSVRYKSNTELIKVRALNRQEKTEQEDELVTHKKKKKKKKMKYENSPEDSRVSDSFTVKKKKKKRRKTEEEAETSQSSLESSFTASPVAEKGDKDAGGEGGRESLYSRMEHAFLKPLPVQDREGVVKKSKRKGESCYYREQRMKEKRIPDEEGGKEKADSCVDQRIDGEGMKRKDTGEGGKRGLTGVTSRLAYNGMLGWETDTSVDNLDYSDDLYHQSPLLIRERMKLARMGSGRQGCVVYSEGEEIEGFVPDSR